MKVLIVLCLSTLATSARVPANSSETNRHSSMLGISSMSIEVVQNYMEVLISDQPFSEESGIEGSSCRECQEFVKLLSSLLRENTGSHAEMLKQVCGDQKPGDRDEKQCADFTQDWNTLEPVLNDEFILGAAGRVCQEMGECGPLAASDCKRLEECQGLDCDFSATKCSCRVARFSNVFQTSTKLQMAENFIAQQNSLSKMTELATFGLPAIGTIMKSKSMTARICFALFSNQNAAKEADKEDAASKKAAEEEDEAKRAAKKAAEEEAEAEKAAKKAAEKEAEAKKAAKKAAEEEAEAKKAAKKAAEEEAEAKRAAKKAAEEEAEAREAAKKAAEEEASAKKTAEEEAAKEEAEAKKAVEEEAAAKKAAEEEAEAEKASKKAAEEEAKAKEAAKKAAKEEAEAKKAVEEEASAKKATEEEAAAKKAAEKTAEEEAAAKKAAEEKAAANLFN